MDHRVVIAASYFAFPVNGSVSWLNEHRVALNERCGKSDAEHSERCAAAADSDEQSPRLPARGGQQGPHPLSRQGQYVLLAIAGLVTRRFANRVAEGGDAAVQRHCSQDQQARQAAEAVRAKLAPLFCLCSSLFCAAT